MKKLVVFAVVCLLVFASYVSIDAEISRQQTLDYARTNTKVSPRQTSKRTSVRSIGSDKSESPTEIESKQADNSITATPLKLNDNCYYFVSGQKVIELNLKTKELKEYAESVQQRQNYWLQVGADGHIYEYANLRIAELTDSSNNSDAASERGVKSRGSSRKSVKSVKKSKYNLKSVDKRSSSSKRGARSAAGEAPADEKIVKFSVVAQDGFIYEYDLEKKTTTKKEEFDGEIKNNFIQIIDVNNELEEIDISELTNSRIDELQNSGKTQSDKLNTESGDRGVKSRSVRSSKKKIENKRKVRSANESCQE